MNKIYLKNKKLKNVFLYNKEKHFYSEDKNLEKYIEIYAGRPSILGNPYSHLNISIAKYKTNSRHEAIVNYKELYLPTITEEIKKINNIFQNNNICLTCWCLPYSCHILEIAKLLCLEHIV